MDRKLGASRNATSIDDSSAYGCLYQWGRGLDGHASIEWASSTSDTGVTGTVSGPVPDPFPVCNDTEKIVTVADTEKLVLMTGFPHGITPCGRRAPLETPVQRDIKCPIDKSGKPR